MMNQPWNAASAGENFNKEKENAERIRTQIVNLQKQTQSLIDIKELTNANVECAKKVADLTSENVEIAKQIAKMTAENQKSSTKQFWASIIVSITALIISLFK